MKARTRLVELKSLAPLSFLHAQELRHVQDAAWDAHHDHILLSWAAEVSTEAQEKLRAIQKAESHERQKWHPIDHLAEGDSLTLEWNETDHPRAPKGTSTGGQWIPKGGSVAGSSKSSSFLDRIKQRNRTVAELTGVVTPGMIRANRLAIELESAASLPGEVARAAAAGLGTGSKAVVNGFVTAVKDVATLGLHPGQLELIGVTKEDRERGYDTAVAISTGSGQLLIAVGTGGISSALSKGGSIARAASGALIVYDAAGNGVGIVQGVYDAANNGINVGNGAKVAAGALGLGANLKATKSLSTSTSPKSSKAVIPATDVDDFVRKLPSTRTPTRSPANLYEIKHTGPYNYTLSGGGAKFDIDGYRGATILEVKHVGNAKSSPYVPGSSCPESVRAEILRGIRDELKRVRTIIKSKSTPFQKIEIITNSPEAKKLFEQLLREAHLPGNVQLKS